MPINSNVFIHESDRAALEALKAIPGFSTLTKSFMRSWNEKLMYINNMSTYVRISENQLPKYHAMLIPICEKLGIEVPDLFLKLDVVPNAYTYGDTKPFIVMTSGLIETMPEELIPTVLAHECGHIACHHTLYRTMGQMLMNGMLSVIPITAVAVVPLKAALAYWMRCSEFSADRAAILCDGTSDKLTEMCMRFAGMTKNIGSEMNLEEFMKQADEYNELVADSRLNKTMEQMLFAFNDHPINAVRASEARKWSQSEDFLKAKAYFDHYSRNEEPDEVPLPVGTKDLQGKTPDEARKTLNEAGFRNIDLTRATDAAIFTKNGTVTAAKIGGNEMKNGDWYPLDAKIELTYYEPLKDEEVRAMHPGEIRLPAAAKTYLGRNCRDVFFELTEAGFTNIRIVKVPDVKKENDRAIGRICEVKINGASLLPKGEWLAKDAEIVLSYHTRV